MLRYFLITGSPQLKRLRLTIVSKNDPTVSSHLFQRIVSGTTAVTSQCHEHDVIILKTSWLVSFRNVSWGCTAVQTTNGYCLNVVFLTSQLKTVFLHNKVLTTDPLCIGCIMGWTFWTNPITGWILQILDYHSFLCTANNFIHKTP